VLAGHDTGGARQPTARSLGSPLLCLSMRGRRSQHNRSQAMAATRYTRLMSIQVQGR
jgi:hypothetical protein